MSHFNQFVTSKICEAANKIKPDLNTVEKLAKALIQSRRWSQAKKFFVEQKGKAICNRLVDKTYLDTETTFGTSIHGFQYCLTHQGPG